MELVEPLFRLKIHNLHQVIQSVIDQTRVFLEECLPVLGNRQVKYMNTD